jgi:hypothetical protein
MASQCISPEVPVKVFKKYCISNAVDGTDDDTLWNDSEEDMNVKMKTNECEEGNSNTDW